MKVKYLNNSLKIQHNCEFQILNVSLKNAEGLPILIAANYMKNKPDQQRVNASHNSSTLSASSPNPRGSKQRQKN